VATEFARAFLRYQSGTHPAPIERQLQATCTAPFARMLLALPATVPTSDRHDPAYGTTHLTSEVYTGPATLGPGPPTEIVIARYRPSGPGPGSGGQLTIHLAATRRGWRVTSIG
jgi:hypothetical protein